LEQVTDADDKTVGYHYNRLNQRDKLTYPDDSYITYVYDAMSRLTDIKDAAQNTLAHYDYDDLSRRTAVTYLNDTYTTYDYENKVPANNDHLGNRLKNITINVDVSTAIKLDYTYDDVGNRKTLDIKKNDTTNEQHSYDYEPEWYQLEEDDIAGSNNSSTAI
jgi:YD repeat-containing protein